MIDRERARKGSIGYDRPDAKDLQTRVIPYIPADKWEDLGVELLQATAELSYIKASSSETKQMCRKMLDNWLNGHDATWNGLINALDRVGLTYLADDIEKNLPSITGITMDTSVPVTRSNQTDNISTIGNVVDWLSGHMKGRYCSMRLKKYEEEKDHWPPIKTKSYVTLAIVHQKELQTRQETTATICLRAKGDIHKIPHTIGTKKLTDIAQIFEPLTGRVPNSILIEGHAGIGKTTLVKQICIQWAEGKLLTSDKLVLLLLLRDPNVQKITNEHKLIEHFTKSTSKVEQLYSYLEDNHGADITLIIDGFDELSTQLRHKSFFRELIEKRYLPKAKIVVTSRPSALAYLHQVVDKRIEILGFEQSSKNQYVIEALQDHHSKAEKLQRHFQQYPNIDAICYIPLIMSIIVFLCMRQPDELPPTATKMYESFILHTIYHYLKRVGKIPEDRIINKLEQFPPVVTITLQDLGKTAFDGLVEDKIVFTVEELPVFCWHDPTCYGLLQSNECYSAEEIGTSTQSFNFLHLGIQEYFAAKYVTTLREHEVYTLLKESFIVTDNEYSAADSKSVRLSNMWILYCGITSGQCKTLRRYLTTYGTLVSIFPPPTIMSLRPSSINPSYHPKPTIYSTYPLTPPRGQHITSHPQPYHLPQSYRLPTQQQQHLIQYPPSMLLSGHARSHDPMMSHPLTMYRSKSTMTHLHSSHDYMFTPPLPSHMIKARSHDLTMYNPSMVQPHSSHDHTLTSPIQTYSTTTTSKRVNSNIDSRVTSEKISGPFQQGFDQRISNTVTISQYVLKDPVKVLYLFQCFKEAQDNELCETLSRTFDRGVIDISGHRLLPHQVVSLGFFLSRSHRKWNELNLGGCYIGDHGMNIIHRYLCRDRTNKQEITEINLDDNDLTGASSHLIADIISHVQPHTLKLQKNIITNVRDISTAVVTTSTVKVLNMRSNGLTAQEAVAISDMMICLEVLYINDNKFGDHGAELLSEGIRNTKTLRVLDISSNNIGSSGTIAIANALVNNTSLEELYMRNNKVGENGAIAMDKVFIDSKTLRKLSLDEMVECYSRTAVGNRKTHEDAIFASLFNQLTILKTLNVHGCSISDKGKELIVAVLSKTILLENINMSNCNLNTIKVTEIVRVLKNVSSVKSLNLSSNAICEEAASDIAQFISNNPELEELNLSDNEISTGVLHIAVALLNIFIRSLDISKNCITADYIEGIVSALAQCPSLEDLNMSNNLLTFTGIIKVAEGLRGHRNIQTLNLNNNLTSFHSEGEFLVDVILSINRSLVYINVCGRNIRPRFTNNHFFPPPGTELPSARFLLQNLYLSQSPSFDMFTFKSTSMNVRDKFIKATEESCRICDQNIVSYYVGHDGGTFYNQDHDFAIAVPPGAVSQGECVEIKATASFLGPYQFPDECDPVSSFFWVSSNYTFKIPVYLIMSHYAVIENVNDINCLCVLQAPACVHNISITNNEKLIMNEVLNGVYFDSEIRYCVLKTQHFCSFCAQGKGKGTLSKKFKVLRYDYKHYDEDIGEEYITEVCFCPNNCDCSKIIEEQCSKKHGKMSPSTYNLFNFTKGQSLHIPDDFSKINGWSVCLNSVVKVPYDSFEYGKIYNNDMERLKEAQDNCEYPPRLQILYSRNDPSIKLDHKFHVEKKEDGDIKSEVVAVFRLIKMAKVLPETVATVQGAVVTPSSTETQIQSAALKRKASTLEDATAEPSAKRSHYEDKQKELSSEVLSQTPKMWDLNRSVVPLIMVHWEDVAYALRYDIPAVNAMGAKYNNDPIKCCKELLKDWVSTDRGVGPKTWEILLKQLEEVPELAASLEKIKKELQK